MKVTRKIQSMVEAKIRHAIATGPLPYIGRGSNTEAHIKQDANKGEANGSEQSK